MEQTKLVNLPVIGRVQHGEKIKNKVTELNHFIAKIQDDNMQEYLNRFDSLYKGKTKIDIEIFDNEPLSIKYARYNQSGEVCHCMEDSNKASNRTKDGWKQIDCDTFNCQYRQRNEQGKKACNRVAWFKFIIPSICKDRIFLMKITGQTSIDRLKEYFSFRKYQGKSIKGNYMIFLKDEEQIDYFGKSHTNKILDILEIENSNNLIQNPQVTENTEKLITNKDENVDNSIPKQEKSTAKKDNNTTKGTTKKSSSKTKKTEKQEDPTEQQTETKGLDDISNFYTLESSKKENIKLSDGTEKEYLIAKFFDMNDKVHNIAIRKEQENLIEKSTPYSVFILSIKQVGNIEFAIKLEPYDEQKNLAA